VIRKLASLMVILVALGGCGNVHPGDAQYPVLNTKPKRTLDITLVEEPSVRPVFRMTWSAENWTEKYQGTCTYWHAGGAGVLGPERWRYSITVPLSFSNEGGVLRSHFAFDLYEPGYCWYEFRDLTYNISPEFDGSFLPLIEYKDDPKLPPSVSVDIWCRHLADLPEDACDTYSTQTKTRPAPVAVGPNSHSLVIRVHDARINSP
jgi:hypothetical protein